MTDELILIDTNILIYAYEEATINEKNKTCFNLIKECLSGKRKLAISNQIISEFIHVATKKTSKPLSNEKVKDIITWIINYNGYVKLDYTSKTTERALKFVIGNKIPYWDALIVATMLENNIKTIYTENVKDFIKVKEIEVINPFN